MNDIALKHSTIVYSIRISFDLVYVNVRYSPQRNTKVGRKSFDSFQLPQANYDRYFLKFQF